MGGQSRFHGSSLHKIHYDGASLRGALDATTTQVITTVTISIGTTQECIHWNADPENAFPAVRCPLSFYCHGANKLLVWLQVIQAVAFNLFPCQLSVYSCG